MRVNLLPPTRLALAVSLTVTCGLSSLCAPALYAATFEHYEMSALPLDQALRQIARQSGRSIVADPALLRGRSSNAVRGDFSAEAAAQRALDGSGLSLRVTDNGTLTVESVPDAVSLPAIDINSRTEGTDNGGHVDGYVAKHSVTGTKTDTPINEIPQTINVITADEMRAHDAQTVTQALRYTPGITGGGFADRVAIFDEPTSRGFDPTPMYLDGLHLPYGGGSTGGSLQIDPYLLERVEVLKGPASVLYGQNQPGGIVNMVSKRPTAEPIHEVVLGGGSQDRAYGAFDFAGPLDAQRNVLYRVTGVIKDQNSEIDYASQKRYTLAPSLTLLPNDRTSLTLYAQAQKDNDVPEAQGLPAEGTLHSGPNGRIKRSTFIGEPGLNSYERNQYTVGYELAHELNDVWTLKQNVRYAYVDDRYVAPLHGYSFVNNPNTGANDHRYFSRYSVDWAQTNKVWGIDNVAQAKFKTAELEHTLLLGVDYYHFNSQFLGRYDRNANAIDLYNPTYGQTLNFTGPYRWDNTIIQTGLYAQDQIKWDRWFLTLGGRQDRARTQNNQPLSGTGSSSQDQQFSGRAGLGYVFDNGITPYLSYSESFLPQTGTNAEGSPFDPTTGKQWEAGVKYQPPGQQAFIQASVYHVVQQNVLTTDPSNSGYSIQAGEVTSKGIELEAKAFIAERLAVTAGVSRNETKYTKSNDGYQGRNVVGVSPLTASVWLDYLFAPGTPLRGLGLGLGSRFNHGSDGTQGADNHFTIPSYTLYDGKLSYDFGQSPLQIKGLKLQGNLENIADKKYVSRCISIWDCYYGEGRTFTTSLSYAW